MFITQQLKPACTPKSLITNVVYKFTCSCNTNIIYNGMTIRHLSVRVEEHLHSKKHSTVQKHINVCQSCKNNKHLFDNFFILKHALLNTVQKSKKHC